MMCGPLPQRILMVMTAYPLIADHGLIGDFLFYTPALGRH